jgi:predicted dehydrogenase
LTVYAIVGSGFGLYGYLPAILAAGDNIVILQESARSRFAARAELARFEPFIRWASNIESALHTANVAVIAVPPEEQPAFVTRCICHTGIGALVLEKPVAASPQYARQLLDLILGEGRSCRVGYTLLAAPFAERLFNAAATTADATLTIEWTFMAHHFAYDVVTWKRRHEEGGGALRFFGIHLIALLARMGYREVHNSTLAGANPEEPERWLATVTGQARAKASILLDCRSTARAFRIILKRNDFEELLVDIPDPFNYANTNKSDSTDRRVGSLVRLISTLGEPDLHHHAHVIDTQQLWEQIEAVTGIEYP